MNVLLLGEQSPPIVDKLSNFGCYIIHKERPITLNDLYANHIDFAVSYRYRHIIKGPIIKALKKRIINLHISLLPWNKGADPNLWSFLEDTPKGVTIHYIDEGIDTGEIIAQKDVYYNINDNLRTTYNRLTTTIEELFCLSWSQIIDETLKSYPQSGPGSYHRSQDKEPFLYLIKNGWDTPVKDLIGKAKNA